MEVGTDVAVPVGEVVGFRKLILQHVDIRQASARDDPQIAALVRKAQGPFEVMRQDGIIDGFDLRDCMVEVERIASGSPAQSAGIQVGDFLLAVNGETPGTAREFQNEAGAEIVFIRKRDLDEAVVLRLKHPKLMSGSQEFCGFKMLLLWYANLLNGRSNFWGLDEHSLAVKFLLLGHAQQAAEVAQRVTQLPLREAEVRNPNYVNRANGDDCDCCADPSQQSRIAVDFAPAGTECAILVHAAALVSLGDLEYAQAMVNDYNAHTRECWTQDWGVFADAVQLQLNAERTKRLTSQDVAFILENAGSHLTDRLLETLLGTYAPDRLGMFRRNKLEDSPLVGARVPDVVGFPIYPQHWAQENGQGNVSLADQLAGMGPDQLLAVIYMGSYRTNGPYSDVVESFAAQFGLLVPEFVVGALVLTYSDLNPETDEFTRSWITSERRAVSDGVPWAVLRCSSRALDTWERALFKTASGNASEFYGAPTNMLVDKDGKVRGMGVSDMFVTLAKMNDMPAATAKPFAVPQAESAAPRPAEMLRGASLKF